MGDLLGSIVITAIAYMAFPLIRLAINNGKFEKKQAKRIALWNSIVVGAFFCIATIGASDGGATWSATPAVLYYFINRALLTDKDEQEYSNDSIQKPISTSVSAPTYSLSHASDKPATPARTDIYGSDVMLVKPETPEINNNDIPTTRPVLFCRQCGHKLAEGAVFCSQCGTKISAE